VLQQIAREEEVLVVLGCVSMAAAEFVQAAAMVNLTST
jgi:molybdopterin biosynthesis enzyme